MFSRRQSIVGMKNRRLVSEDALCDDDDASALERHYSAPENEDIDQRHSGNNYNYNNHSSSNHNNHSSSNHNNINNSSKNVFHRTKQYDRLCQTTTTITTTTTTATTEPMKNKIGSSGMETSSPVMILSETLAPLPPPSSAPTFSETTLGSSSSTFYQSETVTSIPVVTVVGNSNCTADENGNYGQITTNLDEEAIVNYFYQLYIASETDLTLVQFILPAVEVQISNLLLPTVFPNACSIILESTRRQTKRRRFQRRQRATLRHLQATTTTKTTVEGLMASPRDQILGQDCSGDFPTEATDCYLIHGALTLVGTNLSFTTTTNTWNAIHQVMQLGYLNANTTHPAVVRVDFIEQSEVDLNTPPPPQQQSSSHQQPTTTTSALPSSSSSSDGGTIQEPMLVPSSNTTAATTSINSHITTSPSNGERIGISISSICLFLGILTGIYILRRRYQQKRKVMASSFFGVAVVAKDDDEKKKWFDIRKNIV